MESRTSAAESWIRQIIGMAEIVSGDVDHPASDLNDRLRIYKSSSGPLLKFKHVDVTTGEERTFVLDYHSGSIRIIDPADSDSYFEIDPAQAKVAAVGNARPVRQVTLAGYVASPAGVTLTYINSYIRALGFPSSADKSVVWYPQWLPDTVDSDSTIDIYAMVAPDSMQPSSTQFRTTTTLAHDDGEGTGTILMPQSVTTDHVLPANWSHGYEIHLGSFSAPSAGDVIGVRVTFERTWLSDTVAGYVICAIVLRAVFNASEI